MVKRKIFPVSDISIPRVENLTNSEGNVVVLSSSYPPAVTQVVLRDLNRRIERRDFRQWYGLEIDELVYTCQMQIARFVARQDAEVSPATIRTYADKLGGFFDYAIMYASALARAVTLGDVNRQMIDGYLAFLADGRTTTSAQKSAYHAVKAVLKALCRRGLIREAVAGDERTFPVNPFSGVQRKTKAPQPLSTPERKEVVRALRAAIRPLFEEGVIITSELLSYALIFVALHTGRNTTPLLEMRTDALRPHPKENIMFLVLHKRRGHSTSKVALRSARDETLDIESLGAVRPTVIRVIRRVIELTANLRPLAHESIKEMVWIYPMRMPSRARGAIGEAAALTEDTLARGIAYLVKRHNLVDSDGKPLVLNISRLRKTFVNRIFEILDGDLVSTAAAAGNQPRVTDQSYLQSDQDARSRWRFMGDVLVDELRTGTLGSAERTPVGRCRDPEMGDYAPKQDNKPCMSFFNCLRCRNYVVTADDLHRLFSFYWRVLRERARMDSKRWKKHFSHIIRLIDRDVVGKGIEIGVFKKAVVDQERLRARIDPHPFWRADSIITDLASI